MMFYMLLPVILMLLLLLGIALTSGETMNLVFFVVLLFRIDVVNNVGQLGLGDLQTRLLPTFLCNLNYQQKDTSQKVFSIPKYAIKNPFKQEVKHELKHELIHE